MSIALMTQVWKSTLPAGRKMVLLALCDNANDQGECFPSISMLAQKCSMGERTVQQHIADLEDAGIVTREMRNGRSTLYHIDPRRFCTPVESAPPQISHPTTAESAPPPPQNLHHTPADFAPITINESSIEPSGNRQGRMLPAWLPAVDWARYCDYRKKASGKKWTAEAEELNLKKLTKLRDEGHDPVAVIDESIANGWSGLFGLKQQKQASQGTPQLGSAGQQTAAAAQRLRDKLKGQHGH